MFYWEFTTPLSYGKKSIFSPYIETCNVCVLNHKENKCIALENNCSRIFIAWVPDQSQILTKRFNFGFEMKKLDSHTPSAKFLQHHNVQDSFPLLFYSLSFIFFCLFPFPFQFHIFYCLSLFSFNCRPSNNASGVRCTPSTPCTPCTPGHAAAQLSGAQKYYLDAHTTSVTSPAHQSLKFPGATHQMFEHPLGYKIFSTHCSQEFHGPWNAEHSLPRGLTPQHGMLWKDDPWVEHSGSDLEFFVSPESWRNLALVDPLLPP